MSNKNKFHIYHTSLVTPVLNALEEYGINSSFLLEKSMLRKFDVQAEDGYLPALAVHGFFEQVKNTCDLKSLSKFSVNHIGVNSWGDYGSYILSLPTFYDMVEQAVQFESHVQSNGATEFSIHGEIASLVFNFTDIPTLGRQHMEELIFASSIQEFIYIFGETWQPFELSVRNKKLSEIEDILPSGSYEVKLNQPHYAIRFLTSDLSKKFDKPGRPDPSDPPLQLDNSAPMMIDKILLNVNDGSITRLSDVSKYFDMKERTLERYLFNHGTSFRKLREKSLFLRSLNKMDDQQKSIKSIAYDLGYSDLSNFSRAFKRWTGRSPELYRESKLS